MAEAVNIRILQILTVSFDFDLEEVVIGHDFLGIEGEERERGSRIHLEKLQTGDKILGGSYFPIVRIPKFMKCFLFLQRVVCPF